MTCGKGTRTRQRALKSPVELGECSEELEQVEKCMLPECRKYRYRKHSNKCLIGPGLKETTI